MSNLTKLPKILLPKRFSHARLNADSVSLLGKEIPVLARWADDGQLQDIEYHFEEGEDFGEADVEELFKQHKLDPEEKDEKQEREDNAARWSRELADSKSLRELVMEQSRKIEALEKIVSLLAPNNNRLG